MSDGTKPIGAAESEANGAAKAPAGRRGVSLRSGELRSEEAYRRLLSIITEGSLDPGDRLPSETELASQFGISRPLIRQAISRLQEGGLIDVRWGAGSYVRDRAGMMDADPTFGTVESLTDVRHAFELREAVEGDAAALAAMHRLPGPLAAARRALEKLERAVRERTIGEQPDLDFHFAIAAASGNPFFERALRNIRRPMEFTINLTRTMALTHPAERLRVVQGEHVAIMEAVEAGEAEAARRAMRAHLANSCTRLFLGPGAVAAGPSDS